MHDVVENVRQFLGLGRRAKIVNSRNLSTGERQKNDERIELVWEVLIARLLKQASEAHYCLAVVSPLQKDAAWIANYVWMTTQRFGKVHGWVQTIDAISYEQGGQTDRVFWNYFLRSRRALSGC